LDGFVKGERGGAKEEGQSGGYTRSASGKDLGRHIDMVEVIGMKCEGAGTARL